MRKITLVLLRSCYILLIGILLWCLIANISTITGEQRGMLVMPLVLLLIGIFLPRGTFYKIYKWFIVHKTTTLITSLFLILISLGVRIFFLSLHYSPSGDPATFLDMASLISGGDGVFRVIYIGLFPYTLSFDSLLSFGLWVFQSERVAIFFINLLFDVIGAYAIFLLSERITK